MRPSVTQSSRAVVNTLGSAGLAKRPTAVRTSAPKSNRKRILLTGCNSLLGHQLF
jgi:nucleoside-diphosphate-sugar epimerase